MLLSFRIKLFFFKNSVLLKKNLKNNKPQFIGYGSVPHKIQMKIYVDFFGSIHNTTA